MEPLPNIVHRRLQATAKAGIHPDPDLLSGFAARSLTRRERDEVLEHLSHCGDCRVVVLLAGVQPDSKVASALAARSPVWRWPVIRWGTAAACLVIVSAAVLLRYDRFGKTFYDQLEPIAARVRPAPEAQSPPTANVERAMNPAAPSSSEKVVAATRTAKRPRHSEDRSEDTNGGVTDSNTGSRVVASSPAAAPAAAPDLSEQKQASKFEVAGASPAANQSASMKAQAGTVDTTAGLAPARAKSAPNSQQKRIAGSSRMASADGYVSEAPNVETRNVLTLSPRWTLSPDGVLERSMDGGQTWETIPIPAASGLRALATIGTDIWVGGRAGALYHSSDIGEHWTKITPSEDGRTLGADIISVSFTDATHGKLTTANNEAWTTSDGGQSWNKK